MDPEQQRRFLDWRLFSARRDAAEEALTGWEGQAPVPPEIAAFVRHAVALLAEMEYPVVRVGEEGITVEQLLEMQQANHGLPGWMRVEPGETVRPGGEEGAGGIPVPGPSVDYLDGPTTLEGFSDHLSEHGLAELRLEVAHIRAAKQGKVLVITDSRERYQEGLPLVCRVVPMDELEPKDVHEQLLDGLDFYTNDTMGPYVMRDSERVRRAVGERLGWSEY